MKAAVTDGAEGLWLLGPGTAPPLRLRASSSLPGARAAGSPRGAGSLGGFCLQDLPLPPGGTQTDRALRHCWAWGPSNPTAI